MRRRASWRGAIACAAMIGLTLAAQVPDRWRVIDRGAGLEIAFDAFVARLVATDVLLIGEQGGNAATHRMEARLFDALAADRAIGALALEAFDRQAQEPLDHLQMGHLGEAEFLAQVRRPRPDYARDYKPLVDRAIARGWGVVAAAMPRPIAEAVAADGIGVLETLPAAERSLVAATHSCAEVHHAGAPHLPGPRSNVALCLESATLAESIAQAHAAGAIGGRTPLVVALVSDWRLGHLTRLVGDVSARLPGRTVSAVTIAVTPDLQAVSTAPNDLALPRHVIYVEP